MLTGKFGMVPHSGYALKATSCGLPDEAVQSPSVARLGQSLCRKAAARP